MKDKVPTDQTKSITVKSQEEATPVAQTMKKMDEVSHSTERKSTVVKPCKESGKENKRSKRSSAEKSSGNASKSKPKLENTPK